MSQAFTNDLFLVLGVITLVLAIPPLMGAIFDQRPLRTTAILLLIGGSLVLLALWRQPGGYTIEQIPEVFARVVARLIR